MTVLDGVLWRLGLIKKKYYDELAEDYADTMAHMEMQIALVEEEVKRVHIKEQAD